MKAPPFLSDGWRSYQRLWLGKADKRIVGTDNPGAYVNHWYALTHAIADVVQMIVDHNFCVLHHWTP